MTSPECCFRSESCCTREHSTSFANSLSKHGTVLKTAFYKCVVILKSRERQHGFIKNAVRLLKTKTSLNVNHVHMPAPTMMLESEGSMIGAVVIFKIKVSCLAIVKCLTAAKPP